MTARKEVCQVKLQHPMWTLEELSLATKISKPRVWQILKTANLPTKHATRPSRNKSICSGCGKNHNSSYRCLTCYPKPLFMSTPCFNCGAIISRRHVETLRVALHFCNKYCQGQWLGKNKGK